MISSGIQLLSSTLSWLASNALPCAQTNVKDQEVTSVQVNPDKSSIGMVTVIDASLLFKNIDTLVSLGNEAEEKALNAGAILFQTAVYDCCTYAAIFFSLEFRRDSTLITDEKRWPGLFERIENIVKASLDEIFGCGLDIGRGYYLEAGMLSLSKTHKVESYLPFMELSEDDDPKMYAGFLCELFPWRTENYKRLKDFNRDANKFYSIRSDKFRNDKFCRVPDPATYWIRGRIEKIILEVVEKYMK